MITELHVDGLRGLDELDLAPLGRVNVLVGPGGSGKTNLLEAAFLFCGTGDPSLIRTLLELRQIRDVTARELKDHIDWFWTVGREKGICIRGRWEDADRTVLINRLETADVFELKGHADDSNVGEVEQDLSESIAAYEVRTNTAGREDAGYFYVKSFGAKIKAAKSPNLTCQFVTARETGQSRGLAPAWSKAKDRGDGANILAMLSSLDSGIKGVDLRADEAGRASVRIEHERLGAIPVEYMGAGFGKALSISCHIAMSQRGVLLVDEFDASLHVGAQAGLIKFTVESAKKHDVQLVVSTHSLETLDAFLHCYASVEDLWGGPADLRILQLTRDEGSTRIRNLDAEKAKRLRYEIGFDLRRPR